MGKVSYSLIANGCIRVSPKKMTTAWLRFAAVSLLLTAAVHCPPPFAVLVSPATPPALSASLAAPPSSLWCSYSAVFIRGNETRIPELSSETVVDALYDEFLSLLAREGLQPGARVLNANPYEMTGSERIRTGDDFEALGALVKWLHISRICVFSEFASRAQMPVLTDASGDQTLNLYVSAELSQTSLELMVLRQIKAVGLNAFLLLLPPEVCAKVLEAFKANKMDRASLTVVASSAGALYRYRSPPVPDFALSGPVFVAEEGCEDSSTEGELFVCSVSQYLSGRLVRTFSIVNLVNGTATSIGRISNSTVSVWTPVTYYGGAAPVAITPITISFNNGTLNPPGVEAGDREYADYFGVPLLISHIQRTRELLPYHRLHLFNVTLGLFEFDRSWTSAQLSHIRREDLGVAMLPCAYSGVTMGLYSVLSALNYSLPMVGAVNTSPSLSSPAIYPLFSRVVMSDAYIAVLNGLMISVFGWKHVAVIYSDDAWSTGLYKIFADKTKSLGITLVNEEKLRQIPANLTGNYTEHIATYRDIVDSKVRIVMLILYGDALLLSLSALYDLGLRRGDVVFLATEWLQLNLFQLSNAALNEKILNLCSGVLQVFPSVVVGAVGQMVADEYLATYGSPIPFQACFYYDAAYMLAFALDYLIASGGDYENAMLLNRATRSARFKGCTGAVLIQEGTNDRYPMMYSILNSRVYENGTVTIETVGIYNPYGLVLFNFTTPIVWPDNTTTVPTDIRTNSIDCPFEAKQIVTYVPSLLIAYLSLVVISLITVIATAVIWRRYWSRSAENLVTKAEITFEDYMLFATIGVEMLQYGSMGPSFPSWASLLQEASDSFSVELESLVSLKGGMFWKVLWATLIAVGAWMILLVVTFLRLDVRCNWLFGRLGALSEKALPILGNVCFLPIISLLMDVFQCGEAVQQGPTVTYTDSFLKQDCYQHCWTSPHLYYAIAAVVALFVYAPAAVLLRPIWQNMQLYLHIKTAPSFLMIKTMYQIAIIVMNKTLKNVHTISHACLFFAFTALYFAFTLKWKPFGYNRPNLWHYISLLCVMLLTLITLLDTLVGNRVSPYVWLGLFVGGVCSVSLLGVLYQWLKLPAMLYRTKGIYVGDLFRFMLSRGNKYLYLFTSRQSSDCLRQSELQLSARADMTEGHRVPTFSHPRALSSVLV